MLVKKLFFLCILVAIMATWAYSQQHSTIKKSEIIENINGKDYYLHFVKQGETLFEIAKAYGVTVDIIFKINPESRGGIKPGQILKIPMKVQINEQIKSKDSGDDYFVHIVAAKETLYGISKKYSVAIEDIKKLNPGSSDNLREGQALKIPAVKSGKTIDPEQKGEYLSHNVSQGETLYGIARNYNVTIGEIKNANPGLSDQLTIGESIHIPQQPAAEKETAEAARDRFIKYQIRPNETIYVVAKNHAVSVDSIIHYNSGLTEAFKPGQVIRIPQNNSTVKYIFHTSIKKDKLDNIAELYEVSYYDVLLLNPGVHKKVDAGQQIKIPVKIRVDEKMANGDSPELFSEQTSPCNNTEENMERIYNVALMLPFYLEQIDSLENKKEQDITDIKKLASFRFMKFYEGFLMAVDSMNEAGMKLNLFVYDVDNSEEKIQAVLHASELSGMDLIIGPLFNEAFKKLANFAKIYEINIVNPLSLRDEVVYDNPFVFKIKPTPTSQVDKLDLFIQENFPESNVVITRHNKYKYQAEVSYIRNYLNTNRAPNIYMHNQHILDVIKSQKNLDQILTENIFFKRESLKDRPDDSTLISNSVKEVLYVNDSTVGLSLNLSQLRPNIVIAFSEETVFIQDIISQLNKMKSEYDITLFGLPVWNKFTDLETSNLLNLKLHCFSSAIVNYDNRKIKEWILKYREQYNSEPSIQNYAFDGFDIGWYYLNALFLYGTDFSTCIDDFDIQLIQSKYKFEQINNNGYLNTYWNIGEYSDYKFIRVEE